MNCNEFLDCLDRADNGSPSVAMIAHMEHCTECARKYMLLKKAVSLYQITPAINSIDISARVSAILPYVASPRRTVPIRNWIFVGLFIMLSMLIMPLMTDFILLRDSFGGGYTIPLAIVLGVVISIYAGLFVICNIDDLSSLIGKSSHTKPKTSQA